LLTGLHTKKTTADFGIRYLESIYKHSIVQTSFSPEVSEPIKYWIRFTSPVVTAYNSQIHCNFIKQTTAIYYT